MIITDNTWEYLFTICLTLGFAGFFYSLAAARKSVARAAREAGITRRVLLLILIVALLFAALELMFVRPTQQLFFDDVIYQDMAHQLLHSGQAWMCDYATHSFCSIGELFHEPIGTSFNIAIGFALLGTNQMAGYGVMFALTFLGVVFMGLVGMLLFKNKRAALSAELLFAVCPLVLTWAMPTTSDIPAMTYALIAIFSMLVFIREKRAATFALTMFSIVILSYMKVYAAIYVLIIPLMYLALDSSGLRSSIMGNLRLIKRGLANPKALLIILLFLVMIFPEVYFITSKTGDGFGYQGSYVGGSCGTSVVAATGMFTLANFKANICSNVGFWFNLLQKQQLPFPLAFGVLAVLGAVGMVLTNRRTLLALGLWLLFIFLLYTAFYAGAVNYGVDARFMLGVVAQVCLFAGYGVSFITNPGALLHREGKARRSKGTDFSKVGAIVLIAILIIVAYSFYLTIPTISISPGSIAQAADARLYQGFVYNESSVIPNNCLVFTYDPTLFDLNNKSAAQMSYFYQRGFMENASKVYSCAVLDQGYWCYTPNNLCTALQANFTESNLLAGTPGLVDSHFGFYKIPLANGTR